MNNTSINQPVDFGVVDRNLGCSWARLPTMLLDKEMSSCERRGVGDEMDFRSQTFTSGFL
jgi:hypothetical protein